MRIRSILGTILGPVLVVGLLIPGAASPSRADSTVATRIVVPAGAMIFSEFKTPRYNEELTFEVAVEARVDGEWVTATGTGTLTLTRQLAGSAAQTRVATVGSHYLVATSPARGNATYTATFSGGFSDSTGLTYAPTSRSASVKVQRAIKSTAFKRKATTGFKGKLTPGASKKITVFKKAGKRWKKFRTARTNRKGGWLLRLPAPARRGTFNWKLVFAGDKRFLPVSVTGWTKRY